MEKSKKLFTIITVSIITLGSLLILLSGAIAFMKNNSSFTPSQKFDISEPIPVNFGRQAEAAVINGKIEYINAGSSTCPPIIERVEYNSDDSSYTLYVKQYNQVCTADLRGIKQFISYGDGTLISGSSTVRIIH